MSELDIEIAFLFLCVIIILAFFVVYFLLSPGKERLSFLKDLIYYSALSFPGCLFTGLFLAVLFDKLMLYLLGWHYFGGILGFFVYVVIVVKGTQFYVKG